MDGQTSTSGEEGLVLVNRVHLCRIVGECDDKVWFCLGMECVEDGCELERRTDEMGHASEARNYLGGTELFLDRLPAVFCNLPGGFGDKGSKGKPIVILVFLEICKGGEEELVQPRGVFVFHNTSPYLHEVSGIRDVGVWTHLVGECIEEDSLTGGLNIFDRVVVLEHATRRHGPGRDAATMVSRVDRR